MDRRWVSMEEVLRGMRQREIDQWKSEYDSIESIMRHDFERGGGLLGGTPELKQIREALQAIGERAVAWERRMDLY